MPRTVLILLARFALIYGALVWLCASLPVYAAIERAATRIADAALQQRAQQSRALRFEPHASPPAYVYRLRVGAIERELRHGYHKHGFVLVLFAALVLATPGLGPRRSAFCLAAGGMPALLLCAAMLMSDVEGWERAALAQSGLAPGDGPYRVPFGFVLGLHRTAAAGLLPVILWVFLVSRPRETPARTPPSTSAA